MNKHLSFILQNEETNLTHKKKEDSLETAVERIRAKIKAKELSSRVCLEKLELVDALCQFAFGRFLLLHGGLNGFWTHYVVNHPSKGRLTGLNSENHAFTELESFLLDQAPACLATQKRFLIFKNEIQKRLHNNMTLASIPSGLMDEFLDLNFSSLDDFSLVGIDLDQESIAMAYELAKERKLEKHCHFIQEDAWQLEDVQVFDLITSHGLSIYEPDDQRVVDLYKRFNIALKPGGCLITSFLTPPPLLGIKTEWKMDKINPKSALLQKTLFDILESKWQSYRREDVVKAQLNEANFEVIEILYDEAHIFPTIVVKKL